MIQEVTIQAGGATYAQFRPQIPTIILGRILDAQGLPIPGVAVWIDRTSSYREVLAHQKAGAITDRKGRFSLPVDPFRPTSLLVQKQDFAPEDFRVRTRNRWKPLEVTLFAEASLFLHKLPVHGTVFGEIFDKADSYSLSLIRLDRAQGRDREIQSGISYSPQRPELRFDRIPEGDYRIEICASRPGSMSIRDLFEVERRVHVDAGETTSVDWRQLSK